MPQIAVVIFHVATSYLAAFAWLSKQETVVSKIIFVCSENRAKVISRLGSNGGSSET